MASIKPKFNEEEHDKQLLQKLKREIDLQNAEDETMATLEKENQDEKDKSKLYQSIVFEFDKEKDSKESKNEK